MMKAKTAWQFQALLSAALLMGLGACGNSGTQAGGQRGKTAPILLDSSQSATQVSTQSPVTLRVSARDDESPSLSFSWTATVGTWEPRRTRPPPARSSGSPPACTPAGTAAEITATITNRDNLSTSKMFAVAVAACPIFTAVMAGGSHTVALSQDGSVWTWGDNSRGPAGRWDGHASVHAWAGARAHGSHGPGSRN